VKREREGGGERFPSEGEKEKKKRGAKRGEKQEEVGVDYVGTNRK